MEDRECRLSCRVCRALLRLSERAGVDRPDEALKPGRSEIKTAASESGERQAGRRQGLLLLLVHTISVAEELAL